MSPHGTDGPLGGLLHQCASSPDLDSGSWLRSHSILCSCQAVAEHFQQCAEFPLLRNRGLGPLAVAVLPIALAGGPPLPFAPPCNHRRSCGRPAAGSCLCLRRLVLGCAGTPHLGEPTSVGLERIRRAASAHWWPCAGLSAGFTVPPKVARQKNCLVAAHADVMLRGTL
jgi:hypothetical protein